MKSPNDRMMRPSAEKKCVVCKVCVPLHLSRCPNCKSTTFEILSREGVYGGRSRD